MALLLGLGTLIALIPGIGWTIGGWLITVVGALDTAFGAAGNFLQWMGGTQGVQGASLWEGILVTVLVLLLALVLAVVVAMILVALFVYGTPVAIAIAAPALIALFLTFLVIYVATSVALGQCLQDPQCRGSSTA